MNVKKNRFITKAMVLLVAMAMLVTMVPAVAFGATGANENAATPYEETEAKLKELAEESIPTVGTLGGEWLILGLARSGAKDIETINDGYYANVVSYVESNIKAGEKFHNTKSTENSRVILGLTSIGMDVTNVGGHNLLKGLTSMTYVKKQGINGPMWALIAFDSNEYEIPTGDNSNAADADDQVTREKLIEYVLSKKLENGGWALSGTSPDPDMTGMAIQALAPYYNTNEDVKAAVDRGLAVLSTLQTAEGGYASWGSVNAESISQVIVALTALGIDPDEDERFIKNGNTLVDALLKFAVEGGGFKHALSGYGAEYNQMATEQSYYALASYFRFKEGKTSLYHMTDVFATPPATEAVDDEGKIDISFEEPVAVNKIILTEETLTEELKSLDESLLKVVDITAVDKFGQEVSIDNNKMKIRILLDEGETGYKYYQLVFIEDDKIKERINATVEDGYLVAYISHLSQYGVVASNTALTSATSVNGTDSTATSTSTLPKTGDTASLALWVIIALAGGTGVLAIRRNKNTQA